MKDAVMCMSLLHVRIVFTGLAVALHIPYTEHSHLEAILKLVLNEISDMID